MAKQFYGIDLGTTYSCIARLDEHGKPEVLRNSEGDNTTPSVVFFESADNVVVGSAAKEEAALSPDNVIPTVKRVMGDPDWVTEQHGKKYHAQEVSALILRKLVEDASTSLRHGEEITDVVITCPAYFGSPERLATEQAGQIAGLNVHYVVPEPTAAAIAYSMDESENQTIVVYDLGGGTFDVTVLRIEDGSIDVVCVNGDDRLGGKNWDETVANWFAQQFSDETGVPADDLIEDASTWQDLLEYAEKMKIRLSSKQKVIKRITHGGNRVKITLTREKFDELTSSFLERTLSLTQECLDDARAKDQKYAKIDRLLLVGGSTFMPQVKKAVDKEFDFDISYHQPNEAVAKGAALMALKCEFDKELDAWCHQNRSAYDVPDDELREKGAKAVSRESRFSLSGVSQEFLGKRIHNAAPKSFGIVVRGKWVNNLIVKNDPVPAVASKQFQTMYDGQTAVDIICVESDHANGPDGPDIDLDEQQIIGQARLEFGRPLKARSPVQVRVSLRDDLRLELFAKDVTTGREIATELQTGALLTTAELESSKERHASTEVS